MSPQYFLIYSKLTFLIFYNVWLIICKIKVNKSKTFLVILKIIILIFFSLSLCSTEFLQLRIKIFMFYFEI
jgi:hypothetical protein